MLLMMFWRSIFSFIALIVSVNCSLSQDLKRLATPSPQQELWQNMEMSMFIHFAPNTWQAQEYDDMKYPLHGINPSNLDAHQWVDAAEAMGAKQIIFVAKHVGGFCMWPTKTSEYSIKNTPYKNGKGDILKEISDACWERGINLGVYIYPGDRTWGAYLGGSGRTKDPLKQKAYAEILREQWTEVLSSYGNITEIWFDGNCIIPLEDIKEKYSPFSNALAGSMATLRWVGNERGFAPYPAWNSVRIADSRVGVATAAHGNPDGEVWMPLEINTPLKDHYWFWSPDNEQHLKSLDYLIECYYKSVGRGGLFLLNAAPDTTGLIPEADMNLYRRFGNEIRRRFSISIAETKGKGDVVQLDLGGVTQIDHIIIAEDISFGERVRQYLIEGFSGGEWVEITRGLSIGHKRINKFSSIDVDKIRFKSLEHKYTPIIDKLAVYYVGDDKIYDKLDSTKDDFGNAWSLGQIKSYIDLVDLGHVAQFDSKEDEGLIAIDLSKYIDAPGQYELFVSKAEYLNPNKPNSAKIFLQGVETPGFCNIDKVYARIELNITAVPTMVENSINVEFRLNDKISNEKVFLRKVVFK